MTRTNTPDFENLGSLITYTTEGTTHVLGSLMHFAEHGTYDANFGVVPISKEHADIHNRLLDEAMLAGLDENCDIGQRGTFYAVKADDGRVKVTTFMGTVVSEHPLVWTKGQSGLSYRECDRIRQHGRIVTIEFKRKGKVYQGRLQRDADCFNFRRIA
jgi:hypothetical protein